MRVQVLAALCAMTLAAQNQAASLKVAAVQFRSSFHVADNVKRMTEILARLADDHVKVAVFPECALTGYDEGAVRSAGQGEVAAAETRLRETCRRYGIAAIVGSVYKVNGRIYNSAVVLDSHGELVERYAKIHLAGEKWFTPGNHVSFFELEGIPSTVMICHDERYPELVRLPAIQGARIIYYISHESGMKLESKLAPYRAQLMARAVENGVFIVAANAPASPKDLSGSHGQSRIVSPDGNVVKEATFFGEDILTDTLSVKPGKLERPLNDLLGAWWKQGVDLMMKDRHRALD
ncbi:MAG TPA: carbon-nitrogen hydrolase family protein [Bryobacteraceae bacterium]|nr:carbon-nitrogen hydrolase family protein [Bryobacteraceae bacterium]